MLALSSVVLFVGTLVAVPWLLVRLPADYFVRPPPPRSLPWKLLRNLVGALLVLVGLALLVLPGQGILTVLLGLSALDLPVKRRLLRRILGQPRVQEAVQKLRRKAHRPPLQIPGIRSHI